MMEHSPKRHIFTARYWDDPLTFNPSRFLKDWPRDAFLPFSGGEKGFFCFRNVRFSFNDIYRSSCMPWQKVSVFNCFQSKGILLISFFLWFDRFAETEGVAVLTMLVSQYKITIKEEPQFAGETFDERKSRVLSARAGLTLTYVFGIAPSLMEVLINLLFFLLQGRFVFL